MIGGEQVGPLTIYRKGTKEFEKYNAELEKKLEEISNGAENPKNEGKIRKMISDYLEKTPKLKKGIKIGLVALAAAGIIAGIPVSTAGPSIDQYLPHIEEVTAEKGCSLVLNAEYFDCDELRERVNKFTHDCTNGEKKRTVHQRVILSPEYLENVPNMFGACTIVDSAPPSLEDPIISLGFPSGYNKFFISAIDDVGVKYVKIDGVELEAIKGVWHNSIFSADYEKLKPESIIEVADYADHVKQYKLLIEKDDNYVLQRFWKSGNLNGGGGYIKFFSKTLGYKMNAKLEPLV